MTAAMAFTKGLNAPGPTPLRRLNSIAPAAPFAIAVCSSAVTSCRE